MKIGFFVPTVAARAVVDAYASRVPGLVAGENLLAYEGPHDVFAKQAKKLIAALYTLGGMQPNGAAGIRPKYYEPDDDRLHWNETFDRYIEDRAPWQEFEENATSCHVPHRFLSRRKIFERLGPGKERPNLDAMLAELSSDYGRETVDSVLRLMARFLCSMAVGV